MSLPWTDDCAGAGRGARELDQDAPLVVARDHVAGRSPVQSRIGTSVFGSETRRRRRRSCWPIRRSAPRRCRCSPARPRRPRSRCRYSCPGPGCSRRPGSGTGRSDTPLPALPEMMLRSAPRLPPMTLLLPFWIWTPSLPLPRRGGPGRVGADQVAEDQVEVGRDVGPARVEDLDAGLGIARDQVARVRAGRGRCASDDVAGRGIDQHAVVRRCRWRWSRPCRCRCSCPRRRVPVVAGR